MLKCALRKHLKNLLEVLVRHALSSIKPSEPCEFFWFVITDGIHRFALNRHMASPRRVSLVPLRNVFPTENMFQNIFSIVVPFDDSLPIKKGGKPCPILVNIATRKDSN